MENIKIPNWLKIIVISLIVVVTIGVGVYNYFNKQTPSDKLINHDNYLTMVEVSINKSPNFIYVIDKDKKVSNILRLDNDSVNLYNKGLEGKSIEKAVGESMEIIWEDKLFLPNNEITVIDYGNSSAYNLVKSEISKNMVILGVEGNIVEKKTTLKEKGSSLELDGDSEEDLLMEFYLYSKEMVDGYTNKNTCTKGKC